MLTDKKTIQDMTDKVLQKLQMEDEEVYNSKYHYKETIIVCKNTRNISIYIILPTDGSEPFYVYSFLGQTSTKLELFEVMEIVTDIDYVNQDISNLSPAELLSIGFVPEVGINILAVSNMLAKGNYILDISYDTYCTAEYKLNGKTYYDILAMESLIIKGATVAKRPLKVATEYIDN